MLKKLNIFEQIFFFFEYVLKPSSDAHNFHLSTKLSGNGKHSFRFVWHIHNSWDTEEAWTERADSDCLLKDDVQCTTPLDVACITEHLCSTILQIFSEIALDQWQVKGKL